MIPKTLSATSVLAYEQCPKMWEAMYVKWMRSPSNSAADLGTACHEALDRWVTEEHHLLHPATKTWDALLAFYDEEYHTLFSDKSRYDEGKKMLKDWFKRQDFTERKVLSAEEKKSFPVKVILPSGQEHTIPFNYIMDRKDQRLNGQIEVIDYKTVAMPFGPEQLRGKPQARFYGLAAQLEHKDADGIRVTFDLLRHDEVGTVFTKEDNRATRDYLKQVAQRIVDDNNPREKLGDGCRFCPRKDKCKALMTHVKNGGELQADASREDIAQRLYEVQAAASALNSHAESLQKQLLADMESEELIEFEGHGIEVKVGLAGRRSIDPERVRQVVGDQIMAKWGNIRVGQVDEMLKNETELTDDQKSQVRQLFEKNYGDPKAKVSLIPQI